MFASMGLFEAVLLLFLGGVLVLGTLFWVWMLIDCAMNEPPKCGEKVPWLLLIIFTHLLGAVIYFALRRPRRIREYGR